jgi:hypothetical protein
MQRMKKLFNIAILSIVLMSCKKEVTAPTTCDCVEYHEKTELVGTYPSWQLQFVFDYQTDNIPDLCAKDNGTWIYNSNSTQRYKFICH